MHQICVYKELLVLIESIKIGQHIIAEVVCKGFALSLSLLVLVATLAIPAERAAAQTAVMDSSEFFPIGLYGIWLSEHDSVGYGPELPQRKTDIGNLPSSEAWTKEEENYTKLGANYLVTYIPDHVEDALAQHVDPLVYKMDFGWVPWTRVGEREDSSLYSWMKPGTIALPDSFDHDTLVYYRPHTPVLNTAIDSDTSKEWRHWKSKVHECLARIKARCDRWPGTFLTIQAGEEIFLYAPRKLDSIYSLTQTRVQQLAYKFVCDTFS